MQLSRTLLTLGRNDARLVGRDSFLMGMALMVIFISLICRFGLPWLNETVAQTPDVPFSVADLYPMMIGYTAIFLGPTLAGLVMGFVLLDERDERTLIAMLVTPLPLSHYLAYRLIVPWVLGSFYMVLSILLINLALIEVGQLILLSIMSGCVASLITLFMVNFAEGKVQGFALNKILGASGMLIFAAWFLAEPWHWLIGLYPPFWFAKGYWMALAGDANWWLYGLVGLAYTSIILAWLIRRFERRIRD